MQDVNKNTKIRLVKTIGQIIEKYRLKQGKSIYKVSAECSMLKETWRLIESGLVHDIKISSLWKIAEGLGIEPYELLKEAKEILGEDFTISGLD